MEVQRSTAHTIMDFSEGEKVLFLQGLLLCDAQVLKVNLKDDTVQVLVLSGEGNETEGIWIPKAKVLKHNETNLQKQKDLQAKYPNEKRPVKRERPLNFDAETSDNSDQTKHPKIKSFSKVLYCCVTESSCIKTGDTMCDGLESCLVSDKDKVEEGNTSTSPSKQQENSQSSENDTLTEIKGVIFDMDGTLTLPVLDFKGIRESLGLAPGTDILPTVQQYSPEERAKAMTIIEGYEEDGLKKMQLQPGVLDLLHYLAKRDIKRAVMTRNSTRATKAFMEKLKGTLSASQSLYPCLQSSCIFSQVITRDFEPCKPHPAPVLHICEQWGLQTKDVVVVGDDKTDMISGLRAGTGVNILLRNDRNRVQIDYSNFAVDTLTDICSLFDKPMTVFPKEPPKQ